MFVKADLMPHRIRITNIRVERLQDISTDDCLKEGITVATLKALTMPIHTMPQMIRFKPKRWYRTPIEAYKMLSSKLHLHWDSNPLVFVYDFKLIK